MKQWCKSSKGEYPDHEITRLTAFDVPSDGEGDALQSWRAIFEGQVPQKYANFAHTSQGAFVGRRGLRKLSR